MDVGQAKFTENLRSSPFNRDPLIQIYQDGQYLEVSATWEFSNQYVQYNVLYLLFDVRTLVPLLLV